MKGPAQRYARGDATRTRIIETALEVFGTNGFEDAPTRLIARRAGVNLAALHYYFHGKQGLYRACAEHLAELGEARVAPFLALMDQPGASRNELLDLFHRLLDALADRLVEPRDPPAMVAFFLREQIAPTEAYEILHERVMRPMLAACASLIGRLIDQPADAEDSRPARQAQGYPGRRTQAGTPGRTPWILRGCGQSGDRGREGPRALRSTRVRAQADRPQRARRLDPRAAGCDLRRRGR